MARDSSALTTLHRIGVHVVARARQQATGRFSLRVTPGGFGTPEFGDDARRVRIAGDVLVVESDAQGSAAMNARPIGGMTLRDLAALAAVDLDAPLDVGHDTPQLGDVDEPLALDRESADEIARWLALVAGVLDRLVAGAPARSAPTLVRLWPEHFDVAVDLEAAPGVRVNVGGSPGDSYSSEPYLYVGPWTDDRPGDGAYWNAPFGAALRRSQLEAEDPGASALAFLRAGLRRLAG